MTHRRLWSVATALHDVHAPLHCATSVSSWLLFRHQSAVSMSFEDDQEVFASSYLNSGQLSSQWLASRLGVQVRCYPVWLYAPKQCTTFLVDYASNVRQASWYQLLLHVCRRSSRDPAIWRPVSYAGIPCEKTAACRYHLPTGSMVSAPYSRIWRTHVW